MDTRLVAPALAGLFAELTQGVARPGEAYVLNTGDIGLLRSLDKLDADGASQSVDGGATIAAHARHLAYGLSLMNQWVREGGNPFADARWDEAWKTSTVDAGRWQTIRNDLRREVIAWNEALGRAREVSEIELRGMIGSIAHLAYHLGAIRQIAKSARGPKEGSFPTPPTG
jgi:hypothetical protein